MTIKEITAEIEKFAPLSYQEDYDNGGFQVGNPNEEATGALLTLDVTEAVIDEAIEKKCNLIIAHHPIIFKGLKKITGRNYVERIVIKAIQCGITIYAAHTNLDNMQFGVNHLIASKLGLINTQILLPSTHNLIQLYFYTPLDAASSVEQALFAVGAGQLGNYAECSYNSNGNGSFKPMANAHPTIGTANGKREIVEEQKTELLVPAHLINKVVDTLKQVHPYETVAFGLIPLQNSNETIGAGMIGTLPNEMTWTEFSNLLKKNLEVKCIRHTKVINDKINKVALCGGSGSFLLPQAIQQQADVFVTADFKYHQFFDADNQIVIADVGHFETEHFTPEIFEVIIKKKFSNFATILSKINTNPIIYSI